MNRFSFPFSPCPDSLIHFAVLELIDNSIQAQRKREITTNVQVEFVAGKTYFTISVLDHGEGFPVYLYKDTGIHPVPEVSTSDCKGKSNGAGLGLFATQKIFSRFRIRFHNARGHTVPPGKGPIDSSRIELSLNYPDPPLGEDPVFQEGCRLVIDLQPSQ